MRCKICGAEIPDDSKYCQKCGKKITCQSISLDDLKAETKDLQERCNDFQSKQYYASVLERIESESFNSVKYEYGSKIPDFVSDYFDKDGNLIIKVPSNLEGKDTILLIVALLENELECIHAELAEIYIGQHNDRIAELKAGIALYEEFAEDEGLKKQNLANSKAYLRCGLEKIKMELQDVTRIFGSIPRNPILKLFCGIRRKKAYSNCKLAREAIVYCNIGMLYLLKVHLELGQNAEIRRLIPECSNFIVDFTDSKQYKRLYEYDDENQEFWRKNTIGWNEDLLKFEDDLTKRLEEKNIILKIERER